MSIPTDYVVINDDLATMVYDGSGIAASAPAFGNPIHIPAGSEVVIADEMAMSAEEFATCMKVLRKIVKEQYPEECL